MIRGGLKIDSGTHAALELSPTDDSLNLKNYELLIISQCSAFHRCKLLHLTTFAMIIDDNPCN